MLMLCQQMLLGRSEQQSKCNGCSTIPHLTTTNLLFIHFRHPTDKCPTLTNMLVIIVGGIPIAMPTVLSVTLALGAYQLAKEGAIVARMSAVEEMAGMDILCSDKTGTLTLNKLSIEKHSIFTFGNCTPEELIKWGALSANIITEEVSGRCWGAGRGTADALARLQVLVMCSMQLSCELCFTSHAVWCLVCTVGVVAHAV